MEETTDIVTQMMVAKKYCLRLSMEQLAGVLGIAKSTLYNQVSAGTCRVPTYLDGGKRFADYRDVAAHLDACHLTASSGLPA
jgi:AraC-like DNA-binding protein